MGPRGDILPLTIDARPIGGKFNRVFRREEDRERGDRRPFSGAVL
jgi:hypothetical protein